MSDIKRIPYDSHPNRCQNTGSHGQCINLGKLLSNDTYANYCTPHGGAGVQSIINKSTARNYRLSVARFERQMSEKLNQSEIKGLREEISILRICLQERLNRCMDATDLILQSGPISEMVMKIERVVTSCHKLESNMGMLLDRQAILQFANNVITIIAEQVTDEENLSNIADAILVAVGDQ